VVVMLVGVWLSAVALAASPASRESPAAAARAPAQPLVVDSAFSHVDYRTDTATFRDIAVSQGDTRVTAEQAQATGLGFDDSTWTFEGNVVISLQPQGRLRSERAIVEFRDNRVTRATGTGKPAVFEEQRTGTLPSVHGQADEIVYDAQQHTVRLSGEAWLSGRHNERISGPLLVYSIRDERLQAVSPGSQGVHITVTPQAQPPSRRRANGRSGDHHRSLPISSSHSPDARRSGRTLPAGDRA
jgi:lipopolysaccharide transport protein LptA